MTEVGAAVVARMYLRQRMAGRPELDVCLGAGAHTHYLEPDQAVVAGLIDQLIVSAWPPRPHAGETIPDEVGAKAGAL